MCWGKDRRRGKGGERRIDSHLHENEAEPLESEGWSNGGKDNRGGRVIEKRARESRKIKKVSGI